MARIDRITETNEKRLQVGQYLPESIREKKEDGSYQDDYLTIKKLDYETKRKLDYLALLNIPDKFSKTIMKKLKDKKLSYLDYEKLTPEKQAEIMTEIDIDKNDIAALNQSNMENVKCIIENGLKQDGHSFSGANNEKIIMNYEFLNSLGNPELIEFIAKEIKNLSAGLNLGE